MVGSSNLAAMPPRVSLTSSFSVSDANNEVVCPLRNQDGSSCRKRCLGEKRYRSMQEHIRRAHPEHYISKLPATEESFQLMINTPPSERPPPQSSSSLAPHGYHDRSFYGDDSSSPNTPRNLEEYNAASMQPATNAAVALAQLHNHKLEQDWDTELDWLSDTEAHTRNKRTSIDFPPLRRLNQPDVTSEPFPPFNNDRPRSLLPSILSTSPPGRSSTLPPIQRHGSGARPRKQSVSKRAREPQHRRQKSKDTMHMRRMSYDRKAMSAEPSSQLSAFGKRWEDLIDAATSATEDVEDDRTPMPQSPQIPHSPLSINRNSMPPFSASHFQGYQASPLNRALTPPSYSMSGGPEDAIEPGPFPSVEDPNSDPFHMEPRGLSDSSPSFTASVSATAPPMTAQSSTQGMSSSSGVGQGIGHRGSNVSLGGGIGGGGGGGRGGDTIQIYCAACQNVAFLKDSYACTECICGICQACVDVLVAERGGRRKCPRCGTVGGRFRPFQLDIR